MSVERKTGNIVFFVLVFLILVLWWWGWLWPMLWWTVKIIVALGMLVLVYVIFSHNNRVNGQQVNTVNSQHSPQDAEAINLLYPDRQCKNCKTEKQCEMYRPAAGKFRRAAVQKYTNDHLSEYGLERGDEFVTYGRGTGASWEEHTSAKGYKIIRHNSGGNVNVWLVPTGEIALCDDCIKHLYFQFTQEHAGMVLGGLLMAALGGSWVYYFPIDKNGPHTDSERYVGWVTMVATILGIVGSLMVVGGVWTLGRTYLIAGLHSVGLSNSMGRTAALRCALPETSREEFEEVP